MRAFFAPFFSFLLILGLTGYGPIGMAAAGSVGFEIEICAGGAATVVQVGNDGHPIQPGHDCKDCRICCHIAGQQSADARGVNLPFLLVSDTAFLAVGQIAPLTKPNTLPMPRGPPRVHCFVPSYPVLIVAVQDILGKAYPRDGRLFLKDALA